MAISSFDAPPVGQVPPHVAMFHQMGEMFDCGGAIFHLHSQMFHCGGEKFHQMGAMFHRSSALSGSVPDSPRELGKDREGGKTALLTEG